MRRTRRTRRSRGWRLSSSHSPKRLLQRLRIHTRVAAAAAAAAAAALTAVRAAATETAEGGARHGQRLSQRRLLSKGLRSREHGQIVLTDWPCQSSFGNMLRFCPCVKWGLNRVLCPPLQCASCWGVRTHETPALSTMCLMLVSAHTRVYYTHFDVSETHPKETGQPLNPREYRKNLRFLRKTTKKQGLAPKTSGGVSIGSYVRLCNAPPVGECARTKLPLYPRCASCW